MATIAIMSRAGEPIWEGEAESIRDAVTRAVASGAALRGADLRGADLSGADLFGALDTPAAGP